MPYEKVGKNEPVCIADEVPFDIPKNWCWARLGEVFQHNTGKALNSSNTEGKKYKYITTSNLYWDRFELEIVKEMLFTESELEKCTVKKGDLLVCEGGDVGRSAVWYYDFNICIQNHIHRLRSFIPVTTRFYYYVMFLYKSIGLIGGKGIGIQGLSSKAIHNILIPVPPIEEQKRIVKLLNTVQPLVEQYGRIELEVKNLNASLFDLLKKSILQEAVKGKLVPQDLNDEPASALLDKIRSEKQRLIEEGKIKKDKNESIIFTRDNSHYEKRNGKEICIDDEVPFELPDNWIWVRWGTLVESIQYGYNAPAKENGKIKMVRISDIHGNTVDWDSVPYCDIEDNDIETYVLKNNDILFARTGGTVGKSFLVKNISEEAVYAGYLIRTRYSSLLNPEYLKLFMESPLYWNQLKAGTTATAQPNCNGKTLGNMLFPLPPVGEQHRIVDKYNSVTSAL